MPLGVTPVARSARIGGCLSRPERVSTTAMTERKPPGMSFETWVDPRSPGAWRAASSTACRVPASRCPVRSARRERLRVGRREGAPGEPRPLRHAAARPGACGRSGRTCRGGRRNCRRRPPCARWRRTTTIGCGRSGAVPRRAAGRRSRPVPTSRRWSRAGSRAGPRPRRPAAAAPPRRPRLDGGGGSGEDDGMRFVLEVDLDAGALAGERPCRGAGPDPALLGRQP